MIDRPTPHARRGILFALTALALSGCATGYGARGITGGYSDERIDDTHYLVTFGGNGYASRDRVWYFWFYRCAELTTEKGFAFFDVEPVKKAKEKKKQSLLDDRDEAGTRHAVYRPGDGGAPFVPAGYHTITITTWNSSGVVEMFPAVPKGKTVMSAARVLELLGPYVQSNGSAEPPERKVVLRGVAMKLGADQQPRRLFPDGTIGHVDLARLAAGVAEGKAARARLTATRDRMQAELDAGKASFERLRQDHDYETDAKRRAALASQLGARKKSLQDLKARYSAELEAEEERVIRGIAERARPLIEQARSAHQLDTVIEEDLGDLSDVDLTGEVIRLYGERYPVPSAT